MNDENKNNDDGKIERQPKIKPGHFEGECNPKWKPGEAAFVRHEVREIMRQIARERKEAKAAGEEDPAQDVPVNELYTTVCEKVRICQGAAREVGLKHYQYHNMTQLASLFCQAAVGIVAKLVESGADPEEVKSVMHAAMIAADRQLHGKGGD